MRKKNTQKLGEVIQEYLKALKIDDKLKEVRLIRSWDTMVGKTIARSTKEIYIKDRKLFVKLNSSVIRNELFMIRDGLKNALNEQAGESIIDEVILK
jgi:predicted nucleic acid-binding Zn ribbon protein